MSNRLDEIEKQLEEIEKTKNAIKERDLNNVERYPALTQEDILQVGLDVMEKCEKFAPMIKFAILNMMAADERAVYAVKRWLETVKSNEK